MKPAWAVVWHGGTCAMYLNAVDDWSLDPDDTFVFTSWFEAQFAALKVRSAGVEVVRCWT
jgi:hypothetical protein